jgi:hypothetical protein
MSGASYTTPPTSSLPGAAPRWPTTANGNLTSDDTNTYTRSLRRRRGGLGADGGGRPERAQERAGRGLPAVGCAKGAVGGAGEDEGALGGVCSFSADTLVATDQGEQPIGELHVGDQVLA